jgi:hypothetical protein
MRIAPAVSPAKKKENSANIELSGLVSMKKLLNGIKS